MISDAIAGRLLHRMATLSEATERLLPARNYRPDPDEPRDTCAICQTALNHPVRRGRRRKLCPARECQNAWQALRRRTKCARCSRQLVWAGRRSRVLCDGCLLEELRS